MDRISKAKFILWGILGLAASTALTRFIFGLGATTNLTDNTPWGFWIGFDVMGGVALAAGGFVIAAYNYIFRKEEMHPISRAAILTAFLGYLAVAVGLLFDLGLPWNIWHLIIYWNPHSPLFEVGWCVMLYLSVLTLEFAPVVLEKYPNFKVLRYIHGKLNKVKIPIVILGIMLSTLHQSSLGSLFLAMPYKLHPLWYSPIIPIIFLVSAIGLGLMMVMTESTVTSYLYRKDPGIDILSKLKKAAVIVLLIYVVIRFADILYRGAGVFLFEESWGTYLFWFEILLSVIIPLLFFLLAKNKISFLFSGAVIGVIGVVFNRLNIGGLTHLNNLSEINSFYLPSWMELSISAGVVSLAILTFFYFIENYKVWEQQPSNLEDTPERKVSFSFNKTYFGPGNTALRTKASFAFIITFAIGFASISGDKLYSEGTPSIKVQKAKGGDTLFIDGNNNSYGVNFDHKNHSLREKTCTVCHHLNSPGDKNTGCYVCHSEMYSVSDAFNHDWHSSPDGANQDCYECHTKNENKGKNFLDKPKFTTELCIKCHPDIIPTDSKTKVIYKYKILSYTDAMHNMCINCHTERLKKDDSLRKVMPDLDKCSNCHIPGKSNKKYIINKKKLNKWVVIPANQKKEQE